MSTAHTKRRKLIATLKRRHPRNWLAKFHDHCAATRRKLDGPLVGTLADVLPSTPATTPNAQIP